eukprot:209400-Prorocentrum_minimum.AAC.1
MEHGPPHPSGTFRSRRPQTREFLFRATAIDPPGDIYYRPTNGMRTFGALRPPWTDRPTGCVHLALSCLPGLPLRPRLRGLL